MDQKPIPSYPLLAEEDGASAKHLNSDSDDEAVANFDDQKTRVATHRRINRPVDQEAEADEVLGVLLARELRLGDPVLVRMSQDLTAEWMEQRKLVKVPQAFRSRFPHFGFSEKQDHYLFPEEALFLAETARLVLKFDSVLITDFQRLYSLLLGRNGCLSPTIYGFYSRLARRGHRLRRFRRQRELEEVPKKTPSSDQGASSSLGADEYLLALAVPSAGLEKKKKLDPASCGAFYRWDEYALYRELLKAAQRARKGTNVVASDDDDEGVVDLGADPRRTSVVLFPSFANPCRELGRLLGLEESAIQQLFNEWHRFVNSARDYTCQVYVVALDNLQQSASTFLSRENADEERLKAFEEKIASMKRFVSVPHAAAIGLLHGEVQSSDPEDPPIASSNDDDRPRVWEEFRKKLRGKERGMEAAAMSSSIKEWFSRFTVVPDLTKLSNPSDFPHQGFAKKFRRYKDKKRIMLEVDPPPKSAVEGATWPTLVVPLTCSEEDELSLGDVLMLNGARSVGLEADGNFLGSDPILIGSAAGDDYEVLSLTTGSIPTPDEVEDVVFPAGYGFRGGPF